MLTLDGLEEATRAFLALPSSAPLLYGRHDPALGQLGLVTDAAVVDKGLWIRAEARGSLTQARPSGTCSTRSSAGRRRGLSIRGRVAGLRRKGRPTLLKLLDLFEISVTQTPVNPGASLAVVAAKALRLPLPRTLSWRAMKWRRQSAGTRPRPGRLARPANAGASPTAPHRDRTDECAMSRLRKTREAAGLRPERAGAAQRRAGRCASTAGLAEGAPLSPVPAGPARVRARQRVPARLFPRPGPPRRPRNQPHGRRRPMSARDRCGNDRRGPRGASRLRRHSSATIPAVSCPLTRR